MAETNKAKQNLIDLIEGAQLSLEEISKIQTSVEEGVEEVKAGAGQKVEVVIPNAPKGISGKTVTSIIVSALVLINLALPYFNIEKIDLSDDTVYTIGSYVALVINFGYVLWTNHPITKKARLRKAVAEQAVPKQED